MKRELKEKIYFAIFLLLFIFLIIITINLKNGRGPSLQPTEEPQTKIWFGPNHASLDYLDLFSKENLWETSRRNIDVFVLYSESLENKSTDPCPYCGSTSYRTLSNVDAFRKINDWGIEVAVDVPVLKEWDCQAILTIPITHKVIKNLRLGGADIDYISFDEPYYSGVDRVVNGRSCGMTMQESALVVSSYMKNITESFPGIKLGDMEPYPRYSAQQIMDWSNELERLGTKLDFFHLDVNYIYGQRPVDPLELVALKNFFENKNIDFGIIYWNEPKPPSSSNYTNGTLLWTNFVKKNKFYGNDHKIQSWVPNVPINLPETWVNVSHTNLILGALPIILDNDAQFTGQNVPNTMSSGQSYPVSITFLNNGSEVWEEEESYKLVSQNPSNNNIWGVNEVTLNPLEKVFPNEEKTFSFTITAPTTQGVYDFQWKLIHEGIEIFGQPSDNLRINVEPSSISLPNNPSNLIGSITLPNNLRLSWQDNSDNEQGFILEYKSRSSQNWLIVPGADNLQPGTTTYTHSNIPAGNYDYRVGAFNQAGVSYSETIGITIDYGLTLSSLSPSKILKTASSVVSVIGTGFVDGDSKVLINGLDITSLGLTSYINSGLIVINFNPQLLRDLLGDYSISVRSGDGLVTTSSKNLKVNLPFDYLNIIPFSVVSLNPQESINSFMEIQSNIHMDQETVSLSFVPLKDIDIRFVEPNSCIVDTSLEIPLCRINFTISPNASSSGQYNITFNSVSSITFVEHQINVTLNVNICGDGLCRNGESCSTCSQDCGSCEPSGGSSSGRGGSGGSGGGIPKILRQCEDRIDNDDDGLVDFPDDIGCSSPTDPSELDASELVVDEEEEIIEDSSHETKNTKSRVIFGIVLVTLIIGIITIAIIIVLRILNLKKFNTLSSKMNSYIQE